jgi:dephospho-CoA kinase
VTITLKVGLTGGIGSGKSTVARMLYQSGHALIDADAIAKATTDSGGAAIEKIKTVFGPDFITEQGSLDRVRMRGLVFNDVRLKTELEAIIHPLVHLEISRQSCMAEASGYSCIIFDIPLLVESGVWRESMHRILVVDCQEETQISRVVARDALAQKVVEKVMSMQSSREARIRAADLVLFNDGISLQVLASEARQIASQFEL